ncbi:MAG: argininosuccinate synthase [Methanogenium sp.]|nr:argininosuccinate synthase [Methanogenium sp.]
MKNNYKGNKYLRIIFGLLAAGMLLSGFVLTACAAPTTEVTVSVVDENGSGVFEKTVDYTWMEENLPVYGDGVTHYFHQGPVFSDDKETRWDLNETSNFKDRGAVKGTAIKDLCSLAGGMEAGDDLMISAIDGYNVVFDYENVYEAPERQGEIVLCWYNGEDAEKGERQGTGYPPDYYAGMRIILFADNSTNEEGLCVFGNTDMRVSFPEERIHLFDNLYPSTGGYNVKWVDRLTIFKEGYEGGYEVPSKSLSAEKNMETSSKAPAEKSGSGFVLLSVFLSLGVVVAGIYRKERK